MPRDFFDEHFVIIPVTIPGKPADTAAADALREALRDAVTGDNPDPA